MFTRLASVAVVALALAACSSMSAAPASVAGCRSGERAMVQDALYFGTAKAGGVVTADDWSDFLRGTVTPRFPQGLTAWPAAGQWRTADGKVTREASHVLLLVHEGGASEEQSVVDVMKVYKARFQQEAVLRVRVPACVSF